MSDLRPLSASVSKLTTETFSRKFVALGRILSQWADIVGPDMASRTQPVKIHYRKPKTKSEKPQATLDIGTSSADAALLHYQKDLILERINQLYGERWITGIRFVHLAANAPTETNDWTEYAKTSARSKKKLPEEELEPLHAFLSGVDDAEIREKLRSLGESIIRKRILS